VHRFSNAARRRIYFLATQFSTGRARELVGECWHRRARGTAGMAFTAAGHAPYPYSSSARHAAPHMKAQRTTRRPAGRGGRIAGCARVKRLGFASIKPFNPGLWSVRVVCCRAGDSRFAGRGSKIVPRESRHRTQHRVVMAYVVVRALPRGRLALGQKGRWSRNFLGGREGGGGVADPPPPPRSTRPMEGGGGFGRGC
jgi:hypothetical protein